LSNRQVEEGHAFSDLDDGFRSNTTHRGTETTVELQYSKLREKSGVLGFR
jgi:hypothetical protein